MIGHGLNKKLCLSLFLLVITGCTSTYCRQSYRDQDGKIRENKSDTAAAEKSTTVQVFKYDGSLQCGLGQAISLGEMSKQLSDIKIISQKKKNDGLMHITVCGSITGDANVYTISSEDLEKAKSKNFKLWEH